MTNQEKGFGFIKCDDDAEKDVFFHFRELQGGVEAFKNLNSGDCLEFDIVESDQGGKAINVVVL